MKATTRRRLRIAAIAHLVPSLLLAVACGSHPYARKLFRENVLKRRPCVPAPHRPEPGTWSDEEITVAWIGHATTLVNFRGTTILTDPIFSRSVGPKIAGFIPARVRRPVEPVLPFDDLPPIYLVLLSHAHHDHWNMPTLTRFGPETEVIIPRGNVDLLEGCRFGAVHELEIDETAEVAADHLVTRDDESIVFVGDTAETDAFVAPCRENRIRVAILPIGAYGYARNHANPEQVWAIFSAIGADYLMPTHWNTFVLSSEPIERLRAAAADRPGAIVCDEVGTTFVVPPDEAPPPGRRAPVTSDRWSS